MAILWQYLRVPMFALVLLTANQHKKFEVPSFLKQLHQFHILVYDLGPKFK